MSLSVDNNSKIQLFNDLVATVCKAGIWVNSVEKTPRSDALALVVDSSTPSEVTDLISKIREIVRQKTDKAKPEICWMLHEQVKGHIDHKVTQLKENSHDSKLKSAVDLIYNLYLSCKDENYLKYFRGEEVSFAGVPLDFIPSWYKEANFVV